MHKRASLPACPDLRRIIVQGRVKSSGGAQAKNLKKVAVLFSKVVNLTRTGQPFVPGWDSNVRMVQLVQCVELILNGSSYCSRVMSWIGCMDQKDGSTWFLNNFFLPFSQWMNERWRSGPMGHKIQKCPRSRLYRKVMIPPALPLWESDPRILGSSFHFSGEETFASHGNSHPWLPDGYGQILRLYVFGPSGLKDYGSMALDCKI